MTTRICALFTLALLGGCEKSEPPASGKLSSAESELLALLPAEGQFVYGGNFLKLTDVLGGFLGEFMGKLETKAPGLQAWTKCFADHPALTMAGTMDVRHGQIQRYVMKGMSLADIAGCATKAGFTVDRDSDGKFLTIVQKTELGELRLPFLALAGDAVFSRQDMVAQLSADASASSRKTLESEIATTAKQSVATSAPMIALAEKVDRSKAIWLAGNLAGTELGSTVSEVRAAIDFPEGGIDIVAIAVTANDDLAKQVVDGVDQARGMIGSLKPELKPLFDGLSINRSGSKLTVKVKVAASDLRRAIEFKF